MQGIEFKYKIKIKVIGLNTFFLILFIATNVMILPLYYGSEKQDFRRLAAYLKANLREGDKIIDTERLLIGILHYFRVPPEDRQYILDDWKVSEKEAAYRKSFKFQNKLFTIYHSHSCCNQYLADGSRLWIVTGLTTAKILKETTPSILKGYFDGSFSNGVRFPEDASIYLFLWDPQSPDGKGMDLLIQ
jgi:hypothetical protein